MEETLPNGIVVEKGHGTYKFYYKPLYNSTNKKNTRKKRTYKCYLHVNQGLSSSLHISDFDCTGRKKGGGDGKKMLCASFNYLREELGLDDDTLVTLTAMAVRDRPAQEKLNEYFTRTYGFQVIGEMDHLFRTDMSTNIGTIIDKCAISEMPQRLTWHRGGTMKKRKRL